MGIDEATGAVSDLVADPTNVRQHNAQNLRVIAASLQAVGAARSIVVDEENRILAGNGVREAATQAGIERVRFIDADGTEIIAVRRRGLTEAQKRQLAIADNRATDLSTFDIEALKGQLLEFDDPSVLHALGFDDAEWQRILASQQGGLTDPDDVPDRRATDIEAGHLFELGPHRLLCGDATDPDDVRRLLGDEAPLLMVTDPPYGVDYDPTWRRRAHLTTSVRMGRVENDGECDWTGAWRLSPCDVAYVWHAGIHASTVEASLVTAGYRIRSQIIWRKPRFVISRGHYHWQHEPCWYVVRDGKTGWWSGARNQSTVWLGQADLKRCLGCGTVTAVAGAEQVHGTVWEIEAQIADRDTPHSTQKPVECMARPMLNHRTPTIYDPFAGSGSTLIAAEQTQRQVFAMDIDPGWCQVAIDRWERFTGQTAVRVH